jgi:5-methylcytosine-specific restriction enzyme A
MTMRALSVCSNPDCPNTTERGQCRTCRRRGDRRRPNSAQRGYDHRWAGTRARYLAEHPMCEDASGCTELATDVHHRDGLGPLGPLGHDASNLEALCHSHHSRRTALEQPGGVSR